MTDQQHIAEIIARREAALKAKYCDSATYKLLKIIREDIPYLLSQLAAPTADVAPVMRGEWIDEGDGLYSCSLCDIIDHREPRHKFCPNCGADMR